MHADSCFTCLPRVVFLLERIAPVVSVVRLTPSAFHLSWPRPTDASELTQYRVTVVDSASREQWTAEVVSASVGLCFSGLHSGRAYQVALTAAYADGSSASSGHRDIPKEGTSDGDDGCTAIIPTTGTCVSCTHTHTGAWGGTYCGRREEGHTVGGGGHTVFSFLTFGCWGAWFEVMRLCALVTGVPSALFQFSPPTHPLLT